MNSQNYEWVYSVLVEWPGVWQVIAREEDTPQKVVKAAREASPLVQSRWDRVYCKKFLERYNIKAKDFKWDRPEVWDQPEIWAEILDDLLELNWIIWEIETKPESETSSAQGEGKFDKKEGGESVSEKESAISEQGEKAEEEKVAEEIKTYLGNEDGALLRESTYNKVTGLLSDLKTMAEVSAEDIRKKYGDVWSESSGAPILSLASLMAGPEVSAVLTAAQVVGEVLNEWRKNVAGKPYKEIEANVESAQAQIGMEDRELFQMGKELYGTTYENTRRWFRKRTQEIKTLMPVVVQVSELRHLDKIAEQMQVQGVRLDKNFLSYLPDLRHNIQYLFASLLAQPDPRTLVERHLTLKYGGIPRKYKPIVRKIDMSYWRLVPSTDTINYWAAVLRVNRGTVLGEIGEEDTVRFEEWRHAEDDPHYNEFINELKQSGLYKGIGTAGDYWLRNFQDKIVSAQRPYFPTPEQYERMQEEQQQYEDEAKDLIVLDVEGITGGFYGWGPTYYETAPPIGPYLPEEEVSVVSGAAQGGDLGELPAALRDVVLDKAWLELFFNTIEGTTESSKSVSLLAHEVNFEQLEDKGFVIRAGVEINDLYDSCLIEGSSMWRSSGTQKVSGGSANVVPSGGDSRSVAATAPSVGLPSMGWGGAAMPASSIVPAGGDGAMASGGYFLGGLKQLVAGQEKPRGGFSPALDLGAFLLAPFKNLLPSQRPSAPGGRGGRLTERLFQVPQMLLTGLSPAGPFLAAEQLAGNLLDRVFGTQLQPQVVYRFEKGSVQIHTQKISPERLGNVFIDFLRQYSQAQ